MSLLDVQRSLVGFARGSTSEYQGCNNLTQAENEWLRQLLDSSGLHITQQVQQWWRISRVCATAPLTIALLKRNSLDDLIIKYIISEPIRTLFFAAELEQFKTFLHAQPQVDATTKTLIEFELGIKMATQLAAGDNPAQREFFSLSLKFERNPPALFAALLTGAPLPPVEQDEYQLDINPLLASLWICHHHKTTQCIQQENSAHPAVSTLAEIHI